MLASLIPIRDYLYAAVLIGLISFGLYERSHLIEEGETKEAASVAAASAKVDAVAKARIATLTKSHNDVVNQIAEKADEDLAKYTAQHNSDVERLRQLDANHASSAGVRSAASGPPSNDAGGESKVAVDDRFSSLEQVALQLADGNRAGLEAVTACQAERADLVNK